jgi:HSP20 family protein
MSLMRPFSSLREDLNRIFSEIDHEFFPAWASPSARVGETVGRQVHSMWVPAVNMTEEDSEIKVKVQVPGIKPENIEVEVEEGTLTLSGETIEETQEEKGNFLRREIAHGKFYRHLHLPANVLPDKAKAEFENGILTVTLPKSEKTRRHKIKVGGR